MAVSRLAKNTDVRKKEGGIHIRPLENQPLEPPPRVTEADGSDDVHFSFVNFFQWCLGCLSWIFGYVFFKAERFFWVFEGLQKKISIQIVHIKKTFFPIYDLWFLLFWYWNGFMIHMKSHFHTRGAAEEASPPMLPPAMRRTSKKRRKALPPLPPMPPPPPPPLALEDGEVRFGELRWQVPRTMRWVSWKITIFNRKYPLDN